MLRMHYDGRVMACGLLFGDNAGALLSGSEELRRSAKAVIKSAQLDTDPIYRLMGARIALERRAGARALKERAMKILADEARI